MRVVFDNKTKPALAKTFQREDTAVAICSGALHSCAVEQSGTVKCCLDTTGEGKRLVPVPSKECFLEAFSYLKTTKHQPLEGAGGFLLFHVLCVL